MSPEEMANAVVDEWGAIPTGYQRLRKLVAQSFAKVAEEAKEQGRREALAPLNVPGAPLTPLCLEMLEHTVDAMCESARAGVVVPEELVSNLRYVFDHVRYLQGPILDALGHGELDRYRAGLEEGKRVREVWEASSGLYDQEEWTEMFTTKELAVQGVMGRAAKMGHDLSTLDVDNREDGASHWSSRRYWYFVARHMVHGEET